MGCCIRDYNSNEMNKNIGTIIDSNVPARARGTPIVALWFSKAPFFRRNTVP